MNLGFHWAHIVVCTQIDVSAHNNLKAMQVLIQKCSLPISLDNTKLKIFTRHLYSKRSNLAWANILHSLFNSR